MSAAPVAPPVDGFVDWGVKTSFRNYIVGPVARGSVTVGDGAAARPDGFRFPVSGGVFAAQWSVATAGWVRFTGHGGALDITFSSLRVEVQGASGRLVADVTGTSLDDPTPTFRDDVVVATLDLTGLGRPGGGAVVTLDSIPAVLTEAGAAAFSGFYVTGTALDPVGLELRFGGGAVPGPAPQPPPDPIGPTPPTPAPPPAPTPPPAGDPSGERSVAGPTGQTLTVSPVYGLAHEGAVIRVRGTGYDRGVGIYVAFCVDRGAGLPPGPCLGGAAVDGSGGASRWISDNPPPYAVGLTTPFGAGGSFDVELTLAARQLDADGTPVIDCLDGATRCVVATRADHTRPTDRTADVKVPVYFVGQVPPGDGGDQPVAVTSVSLDRTEVRQGEELRVVGTGFVPGEQVEVWLRSTPTWLATAVADAEGGVAATVVIPRDFAPGTHVVELVGVTSGRTARSPELTVLPATGRPAAEAVPVALASPQPTPARFGAVGGTLPRTGGPVGPLPWLPVATALVMVGLVLTASSRLAGRSGSTGSTGLAGSSTSERNPLP